MTALAVFGLCLAPRLAALAFMRTDPIAGYWLVSASLLRSGTLEVAQRPYGIFEPLYPAFLAVSRFLTGDHPYGALVPQVVLASLAGVYLERLVREWSGSRAASSLAAAIYAFYPYAVRHAVAVSEVTPVLFGAVAVAYHAVKSRRKGHAFFLGLAIGFTALIRSATLAGSALTLLALCRARLAPRAALAAATAALVVAPYAAHLHAKTGSWLPPRFGLNLYVGNHPSCEGLVPDFSLDVVTPALRDLLKRETGKSSPYTKKSDDWLKRQALSAIAADPVRAARHFVWKTALLFDVRLVPRHPYSPDQKARFESGRFVVEGGRAERRLGWESLYTLSYSFILLTAVIGLFVRRGKLLSEDAPLLAPLFAMAVVYGMAWPASRFRAPFDVFLIAYAAVGALYAARRFGLLTGKKIVLN